MSIQTLTFEEKKKLINKLKQCAEYYKTFLAGKSFLILYNNGTVAEVHFEAKNFAHLTGVSSSLSAEEFYKQCTAKKGKQINVHDIFTTDRHPHHLAKKKLDVFCNIMDMFSKEAIALEDVIMDKRFFKFGICNLELSILSDYTSGKSFPLYPVSLRSYSTLSKAENNYKVEYVFCKKIGELKYSVLIFPKKINLQYFNNLREIVKDKILTTCIKIQ